MNIKTIQSKVINNRIDNMNNNFTIEFIHDIKEIKQDISGVKDDIKEIKDDIKQKTNIIIALIALIMSINIMILMK